MWDYWYSYKETVKTGDDLKKFIMKEKRKVRLGQIDHLNCLNAIN